MKNVSSKLKIPGLVNTRDLGGIRTADGRVIRPRRLLRSGQLGDLTDEAVSVLKNGYGLHTVVDLRMDVEIAEKPDRKIDGVQTVFCPVLDSSMFGIARDEYSMESWLNLFRTGTQAPDEVFCEMYRRIAFSEDNIPRLRAFFDALLASENGSVLWHCSAGKDRVGVTTALLLGALGVDRSSVIADYHLTEKCIRRERMRIKFFAPLKGYRGRMYKAVVVLFSAKPCYLEAVLDEIDRRFGGIPAFLERHVGITPQEIEKLKALYLD